MSAPWIEVESDHSLPLVHFQLIFPGGALTDPADRRGLTRLTARLMRRGTRTLDAAAVELAIDSLGAELGIETAHTYVRVSGSVIRQNAEALMALVGALVREPALGEVELAQLQRETLAQITDGLDNDAALAGTRFRRLVFRDHPFARSIVGTRASAGSCTISEVRAQHARLFRGGPAIVGFAGDVTRAQAEGWVKTHVGGNAGREPPAMGEPRMPPGRKLCIVDKPARTQTQVFIGRLGTHPHDPDHHALLVGNAVFGGTFTSRLMRAVRSERGWSYGASSRLSIDRVRDSWSMWTHPAASDAAACIALQLELMEQWVHRGVSAQELDFAKSYLTKSHAFSVDTAEKRLEQRIEQRLLSLPSDYFSRHVEHVQAVELDAVNTALRERLDPSNLCVSVLATADGVRGALADAVRVDEVETWPYDREE